MTGHHENRKSPVQVVLELYDAICEGRIPDVLALVDPEVICEPLVRPGLTAYSGHDGIAQLVSDLHAVHGHYQVEIAEVTERAGPEVTVRARLVTEDGHGPPVTSVYTFRAGRIVAIESFPAT